MNPRGIITPKLVLALTFGFGLVTPPVEAGPWVPDAGHFYLKLSADRLSATKLATPDGTNAPIPKFTLDQVWIYGEVGLGHGLLATLQAPVWRRSRLVDYGEASGFGDLKFGLQTRLGERCGWLFALRAEAQAPTGDETRGGGILPTGSGVWEAAALIAAGRSIGGGRGFLWAEAGHQLRTGGLRDALVYRAQFGWNLGSRLTAAATVWGIEPYRGGRHDAITASAAGLGDGVTYLAYSLGASLHLGDGWALEVEGAEGTHARNLALGPTLRVGVSFQR